MKPSVNSKTRLYHFTSKKYGLQAIKNQRLKVAIIEELNDPFELLSPDLTNRNLRYRFLHWKKDISKKFGFLCCSNTLNEPLLWSHYADKHKGVALELEVDNTNIMEVKYRKTRLRLDIEKIKISGGFSESLALKLGKTKYIKWKYEQEYRVPIDLSDCLFDAGNYFQSTDDGLRIVGIVEGPLCKLSAKDARDYVPYGNSITLSRARLAARSYKVIISRKLKKITISN